MTLSYDFMIVNEFFVRSADLFVVFFVFVESRACYVFYFFLFGLLYFCVDFC